MHLLVRAILTGFGLRLGSEVAKAIVRRVRPEDSPEDEAEDEDEDLGTITPDPPPV